jgi:hypothetical protein
MVLSWVIASKFYPQIMVLDPSQVNGLAVIYVSDCTKVNIM